MNLIMFDVYFVQKKIVIVVLLYVDFFEMDMFIVEVIVCCDEFDQLGYVLCDFVVIMKKVGIFCSGMLCKFGGEVLVLVFFLVMVECIFKVDGLVGWVVVFGLVNIYFVVLFIEMQCKIYVSGFDQVYVGGFYLLQEVKVVFGGWEIIGCWYFVSGCKGVDWIGVGIKDSGGFDDGILKFVFMVVMLVFEIEIIDNWNVVGM